MQITQVREDELDQYIASGFYEFDPESGKDLIPVADEVEGGDDSDGEITIEDYTKKEIIAYLEDHNIEYNPRDNKQKLFDKAVANGLGAGSDDDIDDSGIDGLDADDWDDADADALASLDEDDDEDADAEGSEDDAEGDDAESEDAQE